ncbi:MAG: hypothetical protein EA417_19090 [Gammaproteobacteria bacterium]|nr:MAG: hypothetical protein EA417_19090 [Gammaproteobacteria bacterium]
MTSESTSATKPAALKAGIREVEGSIYRHRDNIAIALDGVSQGVGKKIISPGTLIAGAMFGAALQQNFRLRGLRMLSIMQTANEGLRLLLNLIAPGSHAEDNGTSVSESPSV